MPDTIEQIKSRLDIVDVISGYLKVQKSGVNFKARCPFHNEKTPSFYISSERQIWHCFGCSKGGDVFGFIKEIEGVEFPEALRILAAKAGVELERFDPQIRNERTRLLEVCALAVKFFEKQLWHGPAGAQALAYLRDRGVNDETLRVWRIGWAPNEWHALTEFLVGRGFSRKEIVDAGLALEKNGRQYDRFRSRITFPICDASGQVVGFTARIFGQDQDGAKYINTPQTLVYDKSRVLYGLDKAKAAIRSAQRCLLVEGNMDALMSWQAGVQNVVATSGTALTNEQLQTLGRLTQTLDFCFDTDQAGALATRRGIGLALSREFAINVVTIDDRACKDPADYVRAYGEKWQAVAGTAKPVVQFYFDQTMQAFNPQSAESKKAVLATVGPLVKRLVSRVERMHWVSQLALALRAPETAVLEDITNGRDDLASYEHEPRGAGSPAASVAPSAVPEPVDVVSELILSLAMRNLPLVHADLVALNTELLDPQIGGIVARLAAADPAAFSWDAFLKEYAQEGTYRLEFAYIKAQELWQEMSDADVQAQMRWLITKLKRQHVLRSLARIEADIKQAEASGKTDTARALLAEFSTLARELAAPPVVSIQK